MDEYKVAIVIPAFNEEATIFNVVQSVKEYGAVVVVDDASTDRTRKIAEDAGAIVVVHKANLGYNSALNSGFKKALELNCNAAITFDADGQHASDMMPVFIDKLRSGVDLVLGVRPKVQRFAEFIFRVYTKTRFNWEDPLCGMKGYNLSLVSINDMFTYDSIGTEIALNFLKLKCTTVQIPIKTSKRSDKPRFGNILISNFKIVKALVVTVIDTGKLKE